MKTPEQVAAETAKKIVPILVNDSYLSYREDAAKLILAALTEYAKGLEEEHEVDKKRFADSRRGELVQLRAVADDLEDALLTCSPMADYPSEEWTRLSEKRISALTSYTKLRIGEKGAV